MENIKGKRVLITGASSGIGLAAAWMFARHGASLVIASRNIDKLEEIKSQIQGECKVEVSCLQLDVTREKQVREAFASLSEKDKNVDILINSAGLALGLEKFYENSNSDFDQVIDTNLKGLFYVAKEVASHMVKNSIKGQIINIGSTAGQWAYPGSAVYCATKAAVKTLSDGMRQDLIESDIKVTNVQPGAVKTNFSSVRFKGDNERAEKVYEGYEPLTPEDIADTIIYVANLPLNVQISEITVVCNKQADGRTIYKN